MKRIAIIGCGGAGKSTLSHKISSLTGLPVYHLDLISYGADWTILPPEIFRARHDEWITKDKWIIDGMMPDALDERLTRADMVIFLDYPLMTCLCGAFGRLFREYGRVRPDTPEGCRETFDWEFLRYLLHFRRNVRPKILKSLEQHFSTCQIIRFSNRHEAENWLKNWQKI